MLFDTHTHFNFNAFKDDWQEVIERTLEKNVWLVNVGAERKTSARAVEIAKRYPEGVFAAVGLHPIHTYDDVFEEDVKGEKVKFETKAEEFDKEFYAGLLENEKVVAVGETGLDYFHIRKFPKTLNKKLKKKQIEVFEAQIKLSNEYKKPIIVHCRPEKDYDSYKEILEIVKSNKITGIVHCFQGDEKIMEEFLGLGFSLGFNGVITFTKEYDALVANAPLDRIVLETDAPWLAPVPFRGERNESIYVKYVAQKIAEIKNTPYEEVARITTENSIKLFGISKEK